MAGYLDQQAAYLRDQAKSVADRQAAYLALAEPAAGSPEWEDWNREGKRLVDAHVRLLKSEATLAELRRWTADVQRHVLVHFAVSRPDLHAEKTGEPGPRRQYFCCGLLRVDVPPFRFAYDASIPLAPRIIDSIEYMFGMEVRPIGQDMSGVFQLTLQ